MRDPDCEAGRGLRTEAATRGWKVGTPALDVTRDDSVEAAVAGVLRETGGRLDVLVNNAGYYLYGPMAETAPDELRAQLETNVIGVQRVTRAALPALLRQGAGTIVNVGSVSGVVVVPFVGPYHASKFALEALTEALRFELHPFGIRVVIVEPGPFKTELHAKEILVEEARSPDSRYAALLDRYRRLQVGMRRGEVDHVARVIVQAATARWPRLRWRVGPTSFSGGLLRRLIPDRIYEWAIRVVFGLRQTVRTRRG
jgi:NAD(P)-dependent dehydrogenase (short-subunit alcohol dehydrogenase family)